MSADTLFPVIVLLPSSKGFKIVKMFKLFYGSLRNTLPTDRGKGVYIWISLHLALVNSCWLFRLVVLLL